MPDCLSDCSFQSLFSPARPPVFRALKAVPTLQIKADQVVAKASPTLYGLMTEEINYSYEGGLYGELIRNRAFKANPTNAVYWNTIGNCSISLDPATPLNGALNMSLKVDTGNASANSPAGIANDGYWGIPVRPNTTYRASFYAKAANGFTGPLTVAIVSTNGNAATFESRVMSPGPPSLPPVLALITPARLLMPARKFRASPATGRNTKSG